MIAAGPSDAIFNKNTLQADINLVQRANGVIEMFNNKEIDPYTGVAVSKDTYNAATKVKAAFSAIALDKSMPNGGLITSADLKKRENIKQELTKVKR